MLQRLRRTQYLVFLGAFTLALLLVPLLLFRLLTVTPTPLRCTDPNDATYLHPYCTTLLLALNRELAQDQRSLGNLQRTAVSQRTSLGQDLNLDQNVNLLSSQDLDQLYQLTVDIRNTQNNLTSLSAEFPAQMALLQSLYHPLAQTPPTQAADPAQLDPLGSQLSTDQQEVQTLTTSLQLLQTQAMERARASLQAASQAGKIYKSSVATPFNVDSNLTVASGLTLFDINYYLAGTPLAGLGSTFLKVELTDHVNARYFIAHAVLESAFGSSWLAIDKHNLFGYGADDANPYADANTFSSFSACILYVGSQVHIHYLNTNGRFYRGPTLRGMNIYYATDPFWAEEIVAIGNAIPSFSGSHFDGHPAI